MKSTPHLIIAVVGVLIALAITVSPLLDGGGAIPIPITELKVTAKKSSPETPKAETRIVRDPTLARAVDVIKGLSVLNRR